MARRSIGAPLTIGIVLMVLVLALAVGWQALVWNDLRPLGEANSRLDWVLLVLGSIFFLLVMIGLVWLCSWLVEHRLMHCGGFVAWAGAMLSAVERMNGPPALPLFVSVFLHV